MPQVAVSVGAGSRIAGYRLESQIGQGGMAVVFRARDERLGRPVALKVPAPALAADAGFRQRFIRESRAAAAVDDPHIIPVFEAREADGVLFIAMRYVVGGDRRGERCVGAVAGPGPPAHVRTGPRNHGASRVHRGHVLVAYLGQDPLGPLGQGHRRIRAKQHLAGQREAGPGQAEGEPAGFTAARCDDLASSYASDWLRRSGAAVARLAGAGATRDAPDRVGPARCFRSEETTHPSLQINRDCFTSAEN
jgi:hypothetical protein